MKVALIVLLIGFANAASYQQKLNGNGNGYTYSTGGSGSTYSSDSYLRHGSHHGGHHGGSYSGHQGGGYHSGGHHSGGHHYSSSGSDFGGLSLSNGGSHLDSDLVNRLAASVPSSLSGPTVIGTGYAHHSEGAPEHVEDVYSERTVTKPGREIIYKVRTPPQTLKETVVTGRYVSVPQAPKIAVVAIPQKPKVEFVAEEVPPPETYEEEPPKVIEVTADQLPGLGLGHLGGHSQGSGVRHSGSYSHGGSSGYSQGGSGYSGTRFSGHGSSHSGGSYQKKYTGSTYSGPSTGTYSSGSYQKKYSGSSYTKPSTGTYSSGSYQKKLSGNTYTRPSTGTYSSGSYQKKLSNTYSQTRSGTKN